MEGGTIVGIVLKVYIGLTANYYLIKALHNETQTQAHA